jgi:hypothetical protein
MKTLLRAFLGAFLGVWLAIGITGQLTPDKAAKSLELLTKSRQLDLLNHMVPLIMTKEQINRILVPVEKARASVERIKLMEANDLIKYESKINDAVTKGINRDQVPAKALLVELNKLYTGFTIRRNVAAGENADLVYEVLQKELNAGQLKAAANSLDIKAYDPNIDPAKLTEEAKIKFFIKDIFLDPACYDLLVKMSKAEK